MASTNFFQGWESFKVKGKINMVMSISEQGIWTGYVTIIDPEIKDVTMNQIIPFNFRGTSLDLGNVFFDQLKAPVEELQVGFTNIKETQASIVAAQKAAKESQSKPANGSKSTPAPAPAPILPPKYLEMMKRVDELAASKLYGQAITALTKGGKFPNQQTLIDTKMKELKKLGGFILEDDPVDPPAVTEKPGEPGDDDSEGDQPRDDDSEESTPEDDE